MSAIATATANTMIAYSQPSPRFGTLPQFMR